MWGNKQPQPSMPSPSPAPRFETPYTPATPADAIRPVSTAARTAAWLGPSVTVKGEISGNEDLHIEGKVEGPISLGGHRLTVGRSGEVNAAELVAREVVIYGKVHGDIRARDRIEIKKDGSVTGDLTTARIMIEDGAYFKGSVEIDRSNTQVGTNLDSLLARAAPKSD